MSASRPAASASSGISSASSRAEADRLGAEVLAHEALAGARRVALVEDEVDDGQHAGEAIRQLLVARDAVGDAGGGDLALGAHEALGHRRLGDEERARDLGACVSPPSVRNVSATRAVASTARGGSR